MINLSITSDENVSKKRINLLSNAVRYFLDQLVGPNVKINLRLFVAGPRDLAPGIRGICWRARNKSRKWVYFIHIGGRRGAIDQLKTLAHECTHIKQFVINQLVEKADGTILWEKRPYKEEIVVESSSVPQSWERYYSRPWEIDAHGSEYGLLINFLYEYDKNLYKQVRDKE